MPQPSDLGTKSERGGQGTLPCIIWDQNTDFNHNFHTNLELPLAEADLLHHQQTPNHG